MSTLRAKVCASGALLVSAIPSVALQRVEIVDETPMLAAPTMTTPTASKPLEMTPLDSGSVSFLRCIDGDGNREQCCKHVLQLSSFCVIVFGQSALAWFHLRIRSVPTVLLLVFGRASFCELRSSACGYKTECYQG